MFFTPYLVENLRAIAVFNRHFLGNIKGFPREVWRLPKLRQNMSMISPSGFPYDVDINQYEPRFLTVISIANAACCHAAKESWPTVV